MNWDKGSFRVTDDQAQMNVSMIHGFLTRSYWASGIDRATVERSMANSLSMGIFQDQCQVGFGRAVTDRSSFAYLADVFVIPEHRGNGLGKWLVDCFMEHPELRGLRRWLLATADAHGLYSMVGFVLISGGVFKIASAEIYGKPSFPPEPPGGVWEPPSGPSINPGDNIPPKPDKDLVDQEWPERPGGPPPEASLRQSSE